MRRETQTRALGARFYCTPNFDLWTSALVRGAVTACLFAIAACLHIAPAACAVPAGIQKEPAAGTRRAGMQRRRFLRAEKVYCCLRQQQHRAFDLAGAGPPFPGEPSTSPSQLPMPHAPDCPLLQIFPVFCCRGSSLQQAIADPRQHLPQFDGFAQRSVLRGCRRCVQPRRLRVGQDCRLPAEPQQLRITGQQFARAFRRKAIIQRIHKIERDMLGIQLEWWLFLGQM
jgi:hypothetical protein